MNFLKTAKIRPPEKYYFSKKYFFKKEKKSLPHFFILNFVKIFTLKKQSVKSPPKFYALVKSTFHKNNFSVLSFL